MLRAYKYRIYPNREQAAKIEQTLGVCRLVYNLALGIKVDTYRQHGIILTAVDLCNQLPDLKKECSWIAEVNSQSLQASIRKIDTAFKNFFKGKGYPKFKKKSGYQSFQCPANTRKVDFDKGLLTVPKIPNIPITIDRKFEGRIKTITISRTPTGKYYASILVDTGVTLPNKPEVSDNAIGIDLGITHFAIISDGTKIDNGRFYKNGLQRLRVLQKRAARKKKGSNNRKKALRRVALQHEKIVNQRRDFLHKLSTEIVCENQATTICVETLAVKNMVKNRSLAQAISDAGWAEFVRQLEYKCDWYGKNLIKIGRFEASTKTCNDCGYVNKELKLSDRSWTCNECSSTHDRDINAAKNIKFMGLHTGRGTPGEPAEPPTLVGVMKQEYVR